MGRTHELVKKDYDYTSTNSGLSSLAVHWIITGTFLAVILFSSLGVFICLMVRKKRLQAEQTRQIMRANQTNNTRPLNTFPQLEQQQQQRQSVMPKTMSVYVQPLPQPGMQQQQPPPVYMAVAPPPPGVVELQGPPIQAPPQNIYSPQQPWQQPQVAELQAVYQAPVELPGGTVMSVPHR
jgi:hypothetical protein